MIKGAIFDADGTLLDSMGMWEHVGERYLNSLGIEAKPGLREALFPLSLADCAVYFQKEYKVPYSCREIEDGINAIIRVFYSGEVTAKTGAADFLAELKARGVKITLATATDRSCIVAGLNRTGLLTFFDEIFTCGELGVDKNVPDIFHRARDRMGTRTEDTWVFEDAVHAASTAASAGYPVAGVSDPYSDQEKLKELATIYLEDFSDAETFLEQASRER